MIEKYIHHEALVCVDSRLKGKHRDNCLCFKCRYFKPNTESNCCIAQRLFSICKEYHLVTPVYECPYFDITDK